MALEVVGGAALSGFFQQVFVKLDSQDVKNFIRRKKLTDGLLEKLSIELMSVDAVYYDAEQKQLRDPKVKQWLHKLKEAVLRAEDLLDEIKTEALRRKIEAEFGSCTSKVQDLISASFHAFDESVDTKIEEILERLSSISKHKDVLGLKEHCGHRISQTLPSTSLVEDSNVFGRDHDRETIIQLLLSDDVTCNKIGVIPIVGMGGLGKTTLAQLLYNDGRVKQRFEPRAWVCVSDEFDIVKITQTIYASVTSQTCDSTDLNQLQVKLKDALAGKEFLFVLDDVWNLNYNIWDSLKRPFESGAHGSKIIVTTRNDGVASMMGNLQTHYLKLLLEEECWFLFSKHAFKDASVDPNLEVIGRKIVSKCKGLPLAAKSLGGLLRSESNVEEWENVLNSDIWELSDAKINILPALWLSYQYLSPELKRCFAYCSTFPKDYLFDKSQLILLWMAQDLIQPQKKTRLEDVGKKYFDDLISRSFFQYSSYSNDHFIMHDLMHDLATYVYGEFCIRLEDPNFSLDVSKGCHFSYMQYSSNVDYERFDTIYEAKYMRTFILGSLYSSPNVRLDLLLKLQCLRVLKLRGDISELPDSISNLKHLRYLDLCSTQIRKLPDTVCILCNLQTLLLSNCICLAELPTDLRRLINLRHLDFRHTKIRKMPPHMGKLKDLQTFGGEFVLSKDAGGNIDELKGFQHLSGNLHISGLQNIKHADDALEAKLRDKKLSEIHLKWEGDTADSQNDCRVLGNLRPNTNLKVLAIKGYGGTKFPGWLGDESFSNLVTLRLENCGYCFSLPALGQLPSLKRLEIDGLNGVESVGSEFYGGIKPAFKSLEFLSFCSMREWQEWCFPGGEEEEGGHFPNLCELSLDNCPKLTGKIPLYYFPRLERVRLEEVNIESLACSQECNKFNIELPSLRELKISDCPNLVCFVGGGVLLAPNLEEITICHFKNLWSVPEDMQISLPSLPSLSIQGCKEFKSFPEESKFPSLKDLSIMNCPEFRSLPEEMHASLPSLQSLFIHGSEEFKSFPEESKFPSLVVLKIINCPEFRSLPEEMHASLPSLQSLSIKGCKEFKSFPEESKFPSLKDLSIMNCPEFRSLPEEMHASLPSLPSLPSLQSLSIDWCKEFKSFPEESKFPSLKDLKIISCPEFRSLPEEMHASLPSLQSLSINWCEEFKSFPEESKFPSLHSLNIFGCPELESFPEGGLPSKLRSLRIASCKKLMANRMRWGLQTLTSLKVLYVRFSECEEEETVESFPEEGLLPTTLTSLEISHHPNLKTIDGKALRHLISLEELNIYFCPQLQSLPDDGLPTSLSRLNIYKCDLLAQRCQRDTGEDWAKISHIPKVVIDNRKI